MNVHILVELWDSIKPFVSAKERLEMADKIISIFDEHGMLDGIEFETGLDKHLSAALASYVDITEEHDDEDGHW